MSEKTKIITRGISFGTFCVAVMLIINSIAYFAGNAASFFSTIPWFLVFLPWFISAGLVGIILLFFVIIVAIAAAADR